MDDRREYAYALLVIVSLAIIATSATLLSSYVPIMAHSIAMNNNAIQSDAALCEVRQRASGSG